MQGIKLKNMTDLVGLARPVGLTEAVAGLGQLCHVLRSRNAALWNLGLLHCALLVVSGIGLAIDARTVSGLNPWLKPVKFDVSIAIYAWTMAWVLSFVPAKFVRGISRGIVASMLLETVLIGLQAARGVRSHFNHESLLDHAISISIVAGVLVNFCLLIRVTALYFTQRINLPLPALRGTQYGLLSLLLGNLLGVAMLMQSGSSVGSADGGPGLPFLNWSTLTGDLRVSHFVALHGIQVLLLLGNACAHWRTQLSERVRTQFVTAGFVLYTGLTLALFALALRGVPLIAL